MLTEWFRDIKSDLLKHSNIKTTSGGGYVCGAES